MKRRKKEKIDLHVAPFHLSISSDLPSISDPPLSQILLFSQIIPSFPTHSPSPKKIPDFLNDLWSL
jgi:hypothetical protein